MQIFERVADLQQYLQARPKRSIGFVPTMGALHSGHLALVERAAAENHCVVVSIFVNPTQFNNPEDLQHYPRHPEEDLKLLAGKGVTAAFMPSTAEIYPAGVHSEKPDLGGLDEIMEGRHRPGHFQGVATVVVRFFEIVQPTRAYFGEKDFQQLVIIRQVVRARELPVEVVGHPTQRSREGLALSSRNQLLSAEDRQRALLIYRCLQWARQQAGRVTPAEIRTEISERFADSPLELEYVEIADTETLKPLEDWQEANHARIFISAWISGVRLIDNESLF